jgi:hypothetical protein
VLQNNCDDFRFFHGKCVKDTWRAPTTGSSKAQEAGR